MIIIGCDYHPGFQRTNSNTSITSATGVCIQHPAKVIESEGWDSTDGRIGKSQQASELGGRTPSEGVGGPGDMSAA